MVLVALLATMAIVPATALAGAERDYAGTALNIIPSGQYGSVPPPEGADEQARMYNALTPLFRNVTDADLNRLFKPARFGTAGQGPLRVEPIPRPGVRVVRDRYNVPHITGRRRADVVFAAGWVTAQDRGLVLTVARGPGYVAALDVPGIDAFGLVTDLIDFDPSPQAQRFMSRQTELLRRSGPKGRQVVRDIDSFIAGINAYFRAQGSDEEPFTRNDIYGFNALLSSLFGEGGGNESASSMLLDALRTAHGRDRGTDIWNDLREENDPETSFTVPKAFPYEQNRQPGPGNVIIKNGSFQQIYPAGPEVARAASGAGVPRRGEMSNALLISKERSANGHPLFVAGPQIGYFYPGLTMEMDVQGGGMSWRGATSAPFPGYMLIGRGPDFAMSLTSASGDVTDEFAETLCGGSTTRYMFKGRCIPMRRFDAGTLHLPSGPRRIVFYETVHGPVMGYATTTDGRRVAISEHRTNRGREALFQLAFQDLSTGKVRSAETFMRAMNQSPLTFNSFYADDRDVAMFTAGRYPIRPASLDPDLLINGNGNYEYRGYLPFNRHPQGKNPPSGTLINWNNKPAPEFRAADDNFSWGAVHRNQMLVSEIARRRTHTLATVTGAMNAGATQDIRVLRVWPVIEDVITSGGQSAGALDPQVQQLISILNQWQASGGSRRDADQDGSIDSPGAAIMGVAWDKMARAVMGTWLDQSLQQRLSTIMRPDNPPPGGFGAGWYGYLNKDLRTLLGRKVRGPFTTRYCGRGDLAACRASLINALRETAAELTASQGPDPSAWRASARSEEIRFRPVNVFTMDWTNRPSGIQQVMTFTGHRPRGADRRNQRGGNRRGGGRGRAPAFTGDR